MNVSIYVLSEVMRKYAQNEMQWNGVSFTGLLCKCVVNLHTNYFA